MYDWIVRTLSSGPNNLIKSAVMVKYKLTVASDFKALVISLFVTNDGTYRAKITSGTYTIIQDDWSPCG